MNRKWLPYLLMALMVIAIILIRQFKKSSEPAPRPKVTRRDEPRDPAGTNSTRERGFDRRTHFLEYSNHANCRMQCRHISQAEVEAIMQEGKINYAKSDLQTDRCPRYAVEGVTPEDQRVRIVFAQCKEKTVVVTVIDLETDYECDCPGDDAKYKNKQR